MANSKKFQSSTGYGVTVYAAYPNGAHREIRVDADEPYETDDKSIIQALQDSPEIQEVSAKGQKNDVQKQDPADNEEPADSAGRRR